MNIIHQIPPRFEKNQFVAIDLELFGAEEKRLHRPTGEFAALTFTVGENVWFLDTSSQVQAAWDSIGPDCIPVFHNAKFDLMQLRRWATIQPRNVWDTMLIERLLWGGYYDKFGLDALTRRYLHTYMDKSVRASFEKTSELTSEQIEYAALDGINTYQIAQEQLKLIKQGRRDVFRVWKEIDHPALWAFLDFMGFRVDVAAWEALAIENKRLADEAEQNIDFNPRSAQQIKKALSANGFKRLPDTQAATIDKFIKKYPDTKAAEIAKYVLQYKSVYTLHSRYGMKFIKPYMEQENDYWVIHSDYSVTQAETGRTSARNPSMQNIPAREHPEFRKPWIARPGNKLIVADYSAQEPRIATSLSGDSNLISLCNSDEDLYTGIARIAHDKIIEKSDPFRDDMKIDVLAATYGQQPKDEEHEKRLKRFFAAFPQLHNWYQSQIRKKSYVQTISGRRIWLNPYSNQCSRNALNSPIQGTAADMMKRAIGRMHQEWEFDYPFAVVAQIHDECILDVPETIVKDVAMFVGNIMVSVGEEMCPGIKFRASAKIVNTWLEGK